MADPIYPVPEEPVYDARIRALQNSDPANANDVFNPLFSRLIENTHALKLGKADADLGNVSDADFKVKAQVSGVATFDESGKLPADMLPETDVSGAVSMGIQAHNDSPDAHAGLMTGKASQSDFNSHTGNAVAHLTAAERTAWNSKGAPYRFTATIPTSGWSGSASAGYSIALAVSGLVENAAAPPVIDVVQSTDTAAAKLQLQSWGNVSKIMVSTGSITVYCHEKLPGVNIPIQICGVKV